MVQDKEVKKAIISLHFNKDFQTYTDFLQKKLDGLRKENDVQINLILQWNQGKCQILQELIDLFDVAKKELK